MRGQTPLDQCHEIRLRGRICESRCSLRARLEGYNKEVALDRNYFL